MSNSIKQAKLELLKEFNNIVLKQIEYVDNDDIDSVDRLSAKTDSIIERINKIDNQLNNDMLSSEFKSTLKNILTEIKQNTDILISKIDKEKQIAKQKSAKMRTGKKTVMKYNAYNRKTTFGFNALK